MANIVVLAVGLDPLFPEPNGADWRAAGYIFLSANTVRETIGHLKAGEFDLVLMGQAIPASARERLIFLIRSSGTRAPLVSMTNSSSHHDPLADATYEYGSSELLGGVGELLDRKRTGLPGLVTE